MKGMLQLILAEIKASLEEDAGCVTLIISMMILLWCVMYNCCLEFVCQSLVQFDNHQTIFIER